MTGGATAAVETVLSLAERWRRPGEPALADEYERLFVGPGRVPCPPYESLWREDVPRRLQGSLFGPCVGDLESCYAGLGVRAVSGAGELPDHIGVELEALAVAMTDPGYAPIARALLHDHLNTWVSPFCDAVRGHAESRYFRALAADTTRQLGHLEQALTPPDP